MAVYVDPFSMANERPRMVDNACVAALGCKGESFIEAIEDAEWRPRGPAGTFAPLLERRARLFSDCLVRESGDPNGRKEFLHLERLQKMATMRKCCWTDAAKASGSLQDYIAIELAAMSVGMKAC